MTDSVYTVQYGNNLSVIGGKFLKRAVLCGTYMKNAKYLSAYKDDNRVGDSIGSFLGTFQKYDIFMHIYLQQNKWP